MKPYLLENDNVQHEHRLALEAWYAKRHGRRVPFKAILHELMAAKVLEIKREAGRNATEYAKRKYARLIRGLD